MEINNISFLAELKGLQTLDLCGNQINDYSFLKNLTVLQTLDLSYNRISDYSFLENLTGLQSLKLNGNKISNFSFLRNFTVLQTLYLSYNKISDISFLENLTVLQSLNLRGNQISDISFLENLTDLQTLDLFINHISDIRFLENLKGLQTLDLSHNSISDISFLENLTGLQSLYLSGNQISDIRFLLDHIKKGLNPVVVGYASINKIALDKNPLSNPPLSIMKEGRKSVISWLEQMKGGSDPLYESKLMILGQPEAGKSTFTKLQIDPTYQVKDGKLKSTLGVEISPGKEFDHSKKENIKVTAHLWDFGGQDIQKMLHQFFITDDCVYVLVSDKRAENTNFDYWFQIINMLGPNSKVIVLENPKNIDSTSIDFALNRYRELYPKLDISTQEVNLKHTRGKDKTKWKLLNEIITEKLSSLEIVNREVPYRWTKVRDVLKECRNEKYISKDKYYEICISENIGLTKVQADLCLYYFRSLGELSYYDDMGLCTRIFLDHNWLTSGIYYILTDKKIEKSKGRFTRKQAYDSWEQQGYNEEEKEILLNLLLKDRFDICYAIPNKKDVFIAPLLLPDDKPSIWNHNTDLHFRYQYGFIPHGMFSRLIVKLHDKIDEEQRWKTGLRLKVEYKGEPVFAEVQQVTDSENQKVIEIKINGSKEGAKELLSLIREAVQKLHNDFKNLPLKEKIACNCEVCTQRANEKLKPSFYKFEELQERVLNKSYTIACSNAKYKEINIGQIMSDVVLENTAQENLDSRFLQQLKSMGMSINQINNSNTVNQSDFGKANSKATASSTAKAEAINTISIEIKNILGQTKNIKEDIEHELKVNNESEKDINFAKDDIANYENAIQELNKNKTNNEELSQSNIERVTDFVDDLQNEESPIRKTLNMLRRGKNYAVRLSRSYNKIATKFGLQSIPEIILDVVEKI